MIATTLNDILEHNPCNQHGAPEDGGWQKLMAYLGKTEPDDESLPLTVILKSNGLDDALWALRCLGQEHESWIRLMVCDMVEPALQYTDDVKAHEAVRTARRFARGECDADELAAARADARVDALVARADALAEWAAALAAWDAVRDAARDAVWAALTALTALTAVADARAEQEVIFLRYIESMEGK